MVHTNQTWYSLQYGIGTDDHLVTYHNLRAIFLYEPCSWLSVGAEARAQLSPVYDSASAMGFVQIRFK